MNTRKLIIGIIFSILFLTFSVTQATTFYVSPDGNNLNAGTSWATAFKTISNGITEANSGDIVEVNEGTYHEQINFNGKAITLTSTDPNNWDVVANTIIDGNNSISYMVVFNHSENANAVLKGFTIQRAYYYGIYCYTGTAPIIKRCIIRNNNSNYFFGSRGIYCCGDGTSPTIIDNIIKDNKYGIYCYCGSDSSPVIKNNLIYGNKYGISFSGTGAVVIRNNTIVNNTLNGMRKTGTGNNYSINNCIIWNNNDDVNNCTATYSCIQDGDGNGVNGNICSDPCFADADANDFHLKSNSPCINAGDPNTTGLGETDIDNTARKQGGRVDMGADETIYSVHNVTQNKWYTVVQAAIDEAASNNEIVVYPGTYYENINFNGKAITLRSTDPNNWAVVEATIIDGNNAGSVVKFENSEGLTSIISGVTIQHSGSSGRGIYCSGSSPKISKCIIKDNGEYNYEGGGGISCNHSNPIINNCIIADNIADAAGGINIWGGRPQIINCIISGNVSDQDGGGIRCDSSDANIVNCTIVNNRGGDGGGIAIYNASPTIANCIFWSNANIEFLIYSSNPIITYCCVQGGYAGTGNIDSYPYFKDWNHNDFHLTWNSPCINKGDPNFSDNNETDIDGENRVTEEEFVNKRVDIGADEMYLAQSNLLLNPGFEDGVPGHWTDGYPDPNTVVSCDSNNAHSGKYSLKIHNDGIVTSGSRMCSDYIPVKPGHTYRVSAWVKRDTGKECITLQICGGNINYPSISSVPILADHWTELRSSMYANKNTETMKIELFAPYRTEGTVWWDDVNVIEIDSEYLPAYGKANEPNEAETVDFGGSEPNNERLVSGTITSYMSDPIADINDNNIRYRELKDGNTLTIEFPEFNVDANGFPLTPMLLEIMYKDTVDDYTNSAKTECGYMDIDSKIGYNDIDPNYLRSSSWYERIAHLGGNNDGQWKYMQYAFQKSQYQLLRAIDGKFTITITNNNYAHANVPIDYVSLRKISEQDYKKLTNKQRAVRGFYEVNLPADAPDNTDYNDLTIFVRDTMHPVYKHTKPKPNEVNTTITAFSAWGEVEPMSFAIYSKNGINDINIHVSNLTHSGGIPIDGNTIAIDHVIYDEARLFDIAIKSYALVPERLESFSTLSVEPNSSERIWLKVQVPDAKADLAPGLYEGIVTIKQNGVLKKTINVKLNVLDVALEKPNTLNSVYDDPYTHVYSNRLAEVYSKYRETGLTPFMYLPSYHRIFAHPDNQGGLYFDSTRFNEAIARMKKEGVINKGRIHIYIPEYLIVEIYNITLSKSVSDLSSDPNLYTNLSDLRFVTGFEAMIDEYNQVSTRNSIEFIYNITDEPGDLYLRILTDRLFHIIKYHKGKKTSVTYSKSADTAKTVSGNDYYKVPDENQPLPALTALVDYKIWNPDDIDYGYSKRNDPCYPYFGYYTTGHSHLDNPVYNRFLHGLYAFATGTSDVSCYAMGDYSGDPYNDFDGSSYYIFPFTEPDYILAYPTWSGKLLPTMGGLEAIREGIKDAKYIATLKSILADSNQSDPCVIAANNYLTQLKSAIDPNYSLYMGSANELGYYQSILKEISNANDPNDYEAFTRIRETIADYIVLLKSKAGTPSPAYQATDVNITTDLSWTAGISATSHDVYFGTTNPPLFIGNQSGTTYDTGTMATSTTYYWRIDEKNAGGTTTGTVWSFTTLFADPNYVVGGTTDPNVAGNYTATEYTFNGAPIFKLTGQEFYLFKMGGNGDNIPDQYVISYTTNNYQDIDNYWGKGNLTITGNYPADANAGVYTGTAIVTAYVAPPGAASSPTPTNGAINVSTTQDISWTAGSGAATRDVYFGTASTPVTKVIADGTVLTYDTGTMSNNTTYYWRVDEKNAGGTTIGTVWSFTTE